MICVYLPDFRSSSIISSRKFKLRSSDISNFFKLLLSPLSEAKGYLFAYRSAKIRNVGWQVIPNEVRNEVSCRSLIECPLDAKVRRTPLEGAFGLMDSPHERAK